MQSITGSGVGPQTGSIVRETTAVIDWGQFVDIEAVAPYPQPTSPSVQSSDDYAGLQWPPGGAGVFARLIFDSSY